MSDRLPQDENELMNMLTEDRGVPAFGEKHYINWENDHSALISKLVSAWFERGRSGFVKVARSVARDIAETCFERQGDDPEDVNQRIVDATVARTVFSPNTNVGSMNDFIGGALGEIERINQLIDAGYEIVDPRELAHPLELPDSLAARALEILEAIGSDEPISVVSQENKGLDIIAIAPDGYIETEQVKTTSTRPKWASTKEYDRLVWIHDGVTEYKNGKDEDWNKLE